MAARGGKRHHEPNFTARSRLAYREPRRQEAGFDDKGGGRSSVDMRGRDGSNSPSYDNFSFQLSTESCEEIFFCGTGEKGTDWKDAATGARARERTEGAKALSLPWATAAGRHAETRARRAHHRESSNHRIFFSGFLMRQYMLTT